MSDFPNKEFVQMCIYLQKGAIVIDSRLKDVPSSLLTTIEDNIFENDEMEERIDWHGVWKDFDK